MSVGRNDPCSCGSGRKFKHCHGGVRPPPSFGAPAPTAPTATLFREAQQLLARADYGEAMTRYREILGINPEHADARHYLGMALCFQGDSEMGFTHLRASLALKPDDAIYHHNLAVWLEESGDLELGERHYVQALALAPNYREARIGLARLLLRRRRYHAVRLVLEDRVRQYPEDIELGQLYAETQHRLGEHARSREVYLELLQRDSHNHALRLIFAETLQVTGRDQEARAQAGIILQAQPEHREAHRFLALLEERRNQLAEAEQHVTTVLAKSPVDAVALRLLARLQRRTGRAEAALVTLDQVDLEPMAPDDKSHHFMERGAILDKLGRYLEAFDSFRLGNEAMRRFVETEKGETFYDPARTKSEFAALTSYFTRDRISRFMPLLPEPVQPSPLFIVGFPRSGTTLLEQMLAAHPKIHAGDELNGLHLLESSLVARLGNGQAYPACLDELLEPDSKHTLLELREVYLRHARDAGALHEGSHWFTDKMPLNETRLGLIRLLFPESPVIHVVRHPLDVVLSCFMNELFHGGNCALQLETAAFHYAAVHELVEQQIVALGIPYLRVRYEDLIGNPERILRQLLDMAGEPWDPDCLQFHRSARVARTASYAQVNQPLYQSASGRWRQYRQQLEAIVPIVRPAILRLGYEDPG